MVASLLVPGDGWPFWQSNRIVNFLVLRSAVLVLEWTVTCKPNVEHGKNGRLWRLLISED
jgi:hypothetical protein